MNILLIGNGFDIAHNLPTKYEHFLNFCIAASRIYTYSQGANTNDYIHDVLDKQTNNLNNSFKEKLRDLYESRKFTEKTVTTSSARLDELFQNINQNVWFEYFMAYYTNFGENWIDFESEISKVIQVLDSARTELYAGRKLEGLNESQRDIFDNINKSASKHKDINLLLDINKNANSLDRLVQILNNDLDRLIRALEIYLTEFVEKLEITSKNPDIMKLSIDHVLSFNYSDTYERNYGAKKDIKYDYVHGKATITNTVETCNMVLGIDEYLDDVKKNTELEFLPFKKIYQRIYKSTGKHYLDWIDEIKYDYVDYIIKQQHNLHNRTNSSTDSQHCEYYLKRTIFKNSNAPKHNLYIFGHSLDVTDKDILKLFICNDNVQTKIYYYRENDHDKKILGKLIKNLIVIMGQDELIRRTSGAFKTIEFIPQTLPSN